jgi:hypothetical protein
MKKVCFLVISIQLFLIIYFYFGVRGLSIDLDNYAKASNLLNLERDFETYKALDEKNLTILKQDLDKNMMFHLKPIEKDGLKNQIILTNTSHLCKKYNEISDKFKNNYQKKYPKTIYELDLLCKKISIVKEER